MKRLLLFLVLLTVAVGAKEFTVTINTDPPTWLYQFKDVVWVPLGRSGQPVKIEQTDPKPAEIGFRYFSGPPPERLDRAPQAVLAFQSGDLARGVIPSQGVLRPNLSDAELAESSAPFRLKLLALAVAGAGLLVAGVGFLLVRLRQAGARDQRLAELFPHAPDDHLLGTTVGRHVLVSRLGRGGMATVYKGVPRDTLDESQAVAVKMVEVRSMDQESEQRFQREWKVCSELVHPHIVKLLDYGQEGDYRYLVMELVNGETMRSQCTGQGLPPHRVYKLLAPVMNALAYSHSRGIVHRDLKPENVMLSYGANRAEPRILVMDFGLARAHHFETVTVTGNVLGTPAYMAPEQINGRWLDASDQYAAGVMAYELLTGKRPFEHDDPIQIILAHLQQDPVPLREHKPSLSPKLEALVMRMLAKEPQDRFPGMAEALEAWPPEFRNATP